jgi:hypothetical protein
VFPHDLPKVFDDEDDYEYFLTLLKIGLEKENIELYVYCLMSNHFHSYRQSCAVLLRFALNAFASM